MPSDLEPVREGPLDSDKMTNVTDGLLERLDRGPVICAEGYLFELERRGYVQAGAFVPEVVLDHPDVVAQLHRDFVHAGSDVVEAFTYYGHREKMRIVGKEHLLEALNRQALEIAKGVAAETGKLVAGNTCNTNSGPRREAPRPRCARCSANRWAGLRRRTSTTSSPRRSHFGEALIALEVIKEAGLTAVITLTVHQSPSTRDGLELAEACRRLEEAGADVVGLNCCRGPATMLPLLGPIREAVSGRLAALPVP